VFRGPRARATAAHGPLAEALEPPPTSSGRQHVNAEPDLAEDEMIWPFVDTVVLMVEEDAVLLR
jgi:hypothetical protein